MSTTTLSLEEQTLDIEKVSRRLDELEQRLAGLDGELVGERHKRRLLGTILGSLDELETAGAADLFWNPETTHYAPGEQLRQVREHVAALEEKVAELEARREQVFSEIDVETDKLRRLNSELVDIEEEVENLRHEFPVYRDAAEIPYRPLVMPWARNGEDDRRYRKVFLASLAISFAIGAVVLVFEPTHEKRQEEFIPEHIAELIVKKKEEPKKPEPKPQDKPLERTTAAKAPSPQPRAAATDSPSPTAGPVDKPPSTSTPDAQQVARASAQTKGVLAHQNDLAGLIDSSGPVKPGAEGVVSNTGQIAAGTATTRSLIVSQVGTGSGGINVAAISRNGNGGGGTGGAGTGTGGGGGGTGFGGNGLGGGGSSNAGGGGGGGGGGVKVARVQSSTGTAVADARPLSQGKAPSRTDEEIQIVFDRYKAALYRIYNRELRNDPSLKGKMVLQLSIEPDGRVSACAVKSTDLASPALSAEVVERVLKFNFGAKEGVPAITITYPIDFLPAA